MTYMSRTTGTPLSELEHIRQSIADILTTPIGSRVMRRDYGSLLPELMDQPLHGATLIRAYSATVVAIAKWEPRVRITQVTRTVSEDQPGALLLSMTARRIDNNEAVQLTVPMGATS